MVWWRVLLGEGWKAPALPLASQKSYKLHSFTSSTVWNQVLWVSVFSIIKSVQNILN